MSYPKYDDDLPFELPIPGLPRSLHGEGLGDAVKRMARLVKPKPCGGCEQRRQRLNKLARLVRTGGRR